MLCIARHVHVADQGMVITSPRRIVSSMLTMVAGVDVIYQNKSSPRKLSNAATNGSTSHRTHSV